MANNYTAFSFLVNCSPQAADELVAAFKAAEEEDEDIYFGSLIEKDDEGVWIASEESGNPEDISQVIQEWLGSEDRPSHVGFAFSHTCSKPRLNEFGGGAIFITKDDVQWIDAETWLATRTDS